MSACFFMKNCFKILGSISRTSRWCKTHDIRKLNANMKAVSPGDQGGSGRKWAEKKRKKSENGGKKAKMAKV